MSPLRFLIAFSLLSLLIGCAQPRMASIQLVQSNVGRSKSLNVSTNDLQALVRGNSAFAFALYHLLREQEHGNLFYSPFSISMALAMTWAGARGRTEQEMADVLHFTLPQDRLHPAFNALDLELARRGRDVSGKDTQGFRLHIVNALWGQQGFDFLPEFLDVLARNYGAGLRLLDFERDPEAARKVINDWVSRQTENRVRDLIPSGTLDRLSRLVLTNAIYFNAAWAEPFDERLTIEAPFFLLDGSQVIVPMMQQEADWNYAQGEEFQILELPYDDNELSLVLLLPTTERFNEFERTLDVDRVEQILNNLSLHHISLKMPRFRIESSFNLADILPRMGMISAFDPEQADFSGMDGRRDLYIQAVLHKAFVEVDESGTEAAAATAVIMRITAMPMESIEMNVNRPFIFFIRDRQTGTILFVGRVLNPAQ